MSRPGNSDWHGRLPVHFGLTAPCEDEGNARMAARLAISVIRKRAWACGERNTTACNTRSERVIGHIAAGVRATTRRPPACHRLAKTELFWRMGKPRCEKVDCRMG